MRLIYSLLLFSILTVTISAKSVYFDGEDKSMDKILSVNGTNMANVYDSDINSRVGSLSRGVYDIGLDSRSWNNRQDRFLSWDMKISGNYTIYVGLNTIQGFRWIFFNDLNVDVGFHNGGILKGLGLLTNNNSWQRVVVDLDRALKDTEPDNEIISVEGMRFRLIESGGSIDNITLYTPRRVVYENGENGISNWYITDTTPDGASVTVVYDNDEVQINQVRGEEPLLYAYNDNAIFLNGNHRNNAFTLGASSGDRSWNNRTEQILQWKMRTSEHFTIIVHILTTKGQRELLYTDSRSNSGMLSNGFQIHHGIGISRNGEGVPYGQGTDNRWKTFSRDLADDLKDYESDNRLLAVNGITVRGNTLIDDIELLNSVSSNSAKVYEDGEDGTITGWSATIGSLNDIYNVQDGDNRVIQFRGGASGVYMLGALEGVNAWNDREHTHISWDMRTNTPYTIYIAVQTTLGLRYIFYTNSPNRGLLHGFEGGIHHGLGDSTIDGRWRTITRDLSRDLKDAEPENELISVNGFIYNGGDGGMIDNLALFNSEETIYEDGESGVDGWIVSDNTPNGATITNIMDSDLQGRHLQGCVIDLNGSGFDNSYRFSINSSNKQIIQWRFRGFGQAPEVIDPRGIIRDVNAFEFRIKVHTTDGVRALVYTLGEENLGLIENGATIHHGLGDDRIRGSVWAGDTPRNELGLWQGITRDLEEDIKDFEPNNHLISIDSFQVRNSGLIDDIKLLSKANISQQYDNSSNHFTIYENGEDGSTERWHIYDNRPEGATISSVLDSSRGSRVIEFNGNGINNGYEIGARRGDGIWNNTTDKSVRWSMKYSKNFIVFIAIMTTNGERFMQYRPIDTSDGVVNNYIQFGLGSGVNDGQWHTFTRNIVDDLHQFEPDNDLIAINGFLIRGDGMVDDILTIPEGEDNSKVVCEDAEDENIDGWSIYDNISGSATINNIEDELKGSRVIDLRGGTSDGYRLGDKNGHDIWDRIHNSVRWSINSSSYFTFYIQIQTDNGIRYLVYNPRDDTRGLNGPYIRIGLGADASDGTWHTFSRNLEDDLHQFEPDNNLVAIQAFLVRGVVKLDDIVNEFI